MSETRAETVTLYVCPDCEWNRSEGDWQHGNPLTCEACDGPLQVVTATIPPPGSVCVVLSEEEASVVYEGLDPECKGGLEDCPDCILYRALSTKEETPDA